MAGLWVLSSKRYSCLANVIYCIWTRETSGVGNGVICYSRTVLTIWFNWSILLPGKKNINQLKCPCEDRMHDKELLDNKLESKYIWQTQKPEFFKEMIFPGIARITTTLHLTLKIYLTKLITSESLILLWQTLQLFSTQGTIVITDEKPQGSCKRLQFSAGLYYLWILICHWEGDNEILSESGGMLYFSTWRNCDIRIQNA